ncbi:MAG: cation diffusion facilitator family transporter [Promethearchaeota archaeon]
MLFKEIWQTSYLRPILIYLIISISTITIELIFTGEIFWGFWISWLGSFFVARYVIKALDELFNQFHITNKVRNLINPWIFAIVAFIYFSMITFTGYFTRTERSTNVISYVLLMIFIFLIIASITPAIRIFVVAFHRRKTEIFPINRVEYAAMRCLKTGDYSFSKLKKRLRNAFNIFIPNLYFDEETSESAIYHLCGLRYADIKDNIVSLNQDGKEQALIWEKTLQRQDEGFKRILNSRGVLIRSFIFLLALSLLKIFIGFFNSESLLADGFENFLDVLAVVLIGLGIKYDKEKIANIIIAGLMSFTAITLFYDSFLLLFHPEPISNSIIIISISIISIFLNTYLRTLKNFVGKKNRNSSLVASAIDSKINIYISLGVIIGALCSDLGTSFNIPELYYLDAIIAIFVTFFITKEVFEIITEFITGEEEGIDFESFQMTYEQSFEEYIIKWILSVLYKGEDGEFTPERLNQHFQDSLNKGEEIYSEFAHFGLYIFQEKGIVFVIDKLLDQKILNLSKDKTLAITEEGKYLYEEFYSKLLLEDIVDPFDFFFEYDYEIRSLFRRKRDLIEKFEKQTPLTS